MFLMERKTYFSFHIFCLDIVFIPGSVPPVRFGPAGTDPTEMPISAVTYTALSNHNRKVY